MLLKLLRNRNVIRYLALAFIAFDRWHLASLHILIWQDRIFRLHAVLSRVLSCAPGRPPLPRLRAVAVFAEQAIDLALASLFWRPSETSRDQFFPFPFELAAIALQYWFVELSFLVLCSRVEHSSGR